MIFRMIFRDKANVTVYKTIRIRINNIKAKTKCVFCLWNFAPSPLVHSEVVKEVLQSFMKIGMALALNV